MDKKVIEEFVKTLTQEDIDRFKAHDYIGTLVALGSCVAVGMHRQWLLSQCPDQDSQLCLRICGCIQEAYSDVGVAILLPYSEYHLNPCPCRRIKREFVSEFTVQVLKLLGVAPIVYPRDESRCCYT